MGISHSVITRLESKPGDVAYLVPKKINALYCQRGDRRRGVVPGNKRPPSNSWFFVHAFREDKPAELVTTTPVSKVENRHPKCAQPKALGARRDSSRALTPLLQSGRLSSTR
jgi:hypothetical protein